jgi:hypothetical protein
MKKRLFSVSGVLMTATAVATFAFGSVASAALPVGAVGAVVTGTVGLVPPASCASNDYVGVFSGVAITGTFVDSTPKAWAGVVNVAGNEVDAIGTAVVDTWDVSCALPYVPIVATGTLGSTTFGGTGVIPNTPVSDVSMDGSIGTGTLFAQAGALAAAVIPLHYRVDSDPYTDVTAVAVIQVLPLPSNGGSCPSVGTTVCETAIGPVVGA